MSGLFGVFARYVSKNVRLLVGVVGLAGFASHVAGQVVWVNTEQTIAVDGHQAIATAVYQFLNSGSTALEIDAVVPSCECLTAAVDKQGYGPQERGQVTAVFRIGDREGRQERTILLKGRQPRPFEVVLKMRVDIPMAVEIQPGGVFWQREEQPSPKNVVIRLSADARFVGVRCESELFSVQSENLDVSNRRLVIYPRSTRQLGQAAIRVEAVIGNIPRNYIVLAAVR